MIDNNDNNDINDIEFLDLDDTQSLPSLDNVSSSPESASRTKKPSSSSGSSSRTRHSSSSGKLSRAEKRRRRKRKILIQRLVFLAALIVFIVSGVILANTLLNYHKADVIYQDIENAVFSGQPSATGSQSQNTDNSQNNSDVSSDITNETVNTDVILKNYDHAALLALNPDAVGYLQIPAINVLLPVVQGSDNSYYLNHAINGTQSSNGTLFIDCGNKDGIESQNAIIYGHNMKNGSMFGSLKKYNNSDFFNTEGNQYFYFYTGNKIYKYQIYSVHTTPAVSETYTTEFASRDAFFTYIDTMIRASYYSCNLDFYEDSKTITFSTCTNDDATRLVVQGLRIEEINNANSGF